MADQGRGVVVLNGTYRINKHIGLKSGVTVRGGANNLLICDSSAGVDFFTRFSSDRTLVGVVIDSLTATGCGTTNESFVDLYHNKTSAYTAVLDSITIKNNNISGFGDHGIRIALDTTSSYRQDFKHVVVSSNTITNIRHDAIQIGARKSGDWIYNGPVDVTGNHVTDVGRQGVDRVGFGMEIKHASNVYIYRNRVRRTCEDGIRVTVVHNASILANEVAGTRYSTGCNVSGIKSYLSTNVTIQYDTIRDIRNKPHVEIYVGDGNHVTDNYVDGLGWGSSDIGIEVRAGVQGPAKNAFLRGNKIRDVSNGIKVVAIDGMDVRDVDVINNTVSASCTGIWLNSQNDYVRHVKIAGNTVGTAASSCASGDPVALYKAGYIEIWDNWLWGSTNDAAMVNSVGSWCVDYRNDGKWPAGC